MEQNETFQMTYSAQEQKEIEAIRKKYAPPETDKMEQLRALDAGVSKKATATALSVGIIGTLLLGGGMSLIMSELGRVLGDAAFPVGLGTGLVGIVLVVCAYPIYLRKLKRERTKIAPEILRLTDELKK